jgi:hypothetical protein
MSANIPSNVDSYIWMSWKRYADHGMRIPCLILANGDLRGDAGAQARALGLEVGSNIGSIYTAFLPADWDTICKIAAEPCISCIEASR